jgi:hypothetical protein
MVRQIYRKRQRASNAVTFRVTALDVMNVRWKSTFASTATITRKRVTLNVMASAQAYPLIASIAGRLPAGCAFVVKLRSQAKGNADKLKRVVHTPKSLCRTKIRDGLIPDAGIC